MSNKNIINCNNNLIIEFTTTDFIDCSFLITIKHRTSRSPTKAVASSAHKVLTVGLNQFNSLSIAEAKSIAVA